MRVWAKLHEPNEEIASVYEGDVIGWMPRHGRKVRDLPPEANTVPAEARYL